ncbi:MAG: hypothetical protein JKY27_02080, partial [Magnetovibrio sp.]|nr:hypothetical protein [Magnetovibrio sp.]
MSEDQEYQTTRWWLVRHAPVKDAHLAKIWGQKDIEADVSDTASFAHLAAKLPHGAVWFTTHLQRTQQTAEALFAAGAAGALSVGGPYSALGPFASIAGMPGI